MRTFLRYICRAASHPSYSTVSKILHKLESRPIKEELMTIADELIQTGMEKGRRIGRIQTLEELLGREASAPEVLAEKSADELERMEASLRDDLRHASSTAKGI